MEREMSWEPVVPPHSIEFTPGNVNEKRWTLGLGPNGVKNRQRKSVEALTQEYDHAGLPLPVLRHVHAQVDLQCTCCAQRVNVAHLQLWHTLTGCGQTQSASLPHT